MKTDLLFITGIALAIPLSRVHGDSLNPQVGQPLFAVTDDKIVASEPKGGAISAGKVYTFVQGDDLDKQMFQVFDGTYLLIANRADFRTTTPQEKQTDFQTKLAASKERAFRKYPSLLDKNSELSKKVSELLKEAASPSDEMHDDLYDPDAPYIFASVAADTLEVSKKAATTKPAPTPIPKEWIVVHHITLPTGEILKKGMPVYFVKRENKNGYPGYWVRRPWTVLSIWVPAWGIAPLNSTAGRQAMGGGLPERQSPD